MIYRSFLIVMACFVPLLAQANDHPMFHQSGLPVPRFVSLKSNLINMRVGPGKDYPINWVYRRRGLPVEIVEEFGHWRKIRDHEGSEGWLHHSLLSGERMALVIPAGDQSSAPIFRAADTNSGRLAELESQVVVTLLACDHKWCQIDVKDYEGWIKREHVWGLYSQEQIEE